MILPSSKINTQYVRNLFKDQQNKLQIIKDIHASGHAGLKDHKKMVESLRRGDMIVTQGGLIGKVTKVKEDNELEVELSEGVKVRVVQSTVAQVLSKTEPAA